MTDYYELTDTLSLNELKKICPSVCEFMTNYRLEGLDDKLTFFEAVSAAKKSVLDEYGMSAEDAQDELCVFLEALERSTDCGAIKELTIVGGYDKDGVPENISLTVSAGEAVALVGPTGAGKSRLLADIECAARGDTPTKRHILFDGLELPDERRFEMGSSIVAQLSQNMNFVIDMSVENFLRLHTRCRGGLDALDAVERCFALANELSGEPFQRDCKVTQLSGGQSRALMIADAALMSQSPILLIDEIENAGIDRMRAVKLLMGENKIVLISTHDPLLALSASRRVVLKNGGISALIETSQEERSRLDELSAMENKTSSMRRALRCGKHIEGEY